MKIGDLVRVKNKTRYGIIVEVPPPDDYWGDTAVVEWVDGFTEEITADHLEVIK